MQTFGFVFLKFWSYLCKLAAVLRFPVISRKSVWLQVYNASCMNIQVAWMCNLVELCRYNKLFLQYIIPHRFTDDINYIITHQSKQIYFIAFALRDLQESICICIWICLFVCFLMTTLCCLYNICHTMFVTGNHCVGYLTKHKLPQTMK